MKLKFSVVFIVFLGVVQNIRSDDADAGLLGGSTTSKSELFSDNSTEEDEKPKTIKNGTEKKAIGHLYLPEDYNKFEIPDEGAALGLKGPLIVRVHIRIREIGDLNELDEKLTVTVDVRLSWKDWRIFKANQKNLDPSVEQPNTDTTGFNFVVKREVDLNKPQPDQKIKKLDPSFLKHIWKPDLFIESLVETSRPEFIAKPVKFVFKPDGTLVLQSRVTITVGCTMDFHYYPADTHECWFNIRSYAFESDEMELEWGHPKPSVYAHDRHNTNFEIQLLENNYTQITEQSLDEPEMVWGFVGGETFLNTTGRNATFDVLRFAIKARRKLSFHLIQTYLPSVFFIGITWLCFVFPPRMVEVRIGITMTTLLTMTAMFASVRESTPIVSYMKAIDIWMIACIAFIFITLLEFASLVWFRIHEEDKESEDESASKESKKNGGGSVTEFEMEDRTGSTNPISTNAPTKRNDRTWSNPTPAMLERLVAVGFLIFFIGFCIFYWFWLFTASQYFDWTVDPTYNAMEE